MNKHMQMDFDAVVRLLGGLYIALAYAMPGEAHHLAHDVLMGFAEDPDVRPEDRRAYRLIALTGDRIDQPHFEVVTGGAA